MMASKAHANVVVRFEPAVWGLEFDVGRLERVSLGDLDMAVVEAALEGGFHAVQDEVPEEEVVGVWAGYHVWQGLLF
jgi:hypothetical protein